MLIYPYKVGSRSVKLLCETLNAKRIKHKNSKFKGGGFKKVINWGSSGLPDEVMKCQLYNHPLAVSIATNKLNLFNFCVDCGVGEYIPPFTTNIEVAKSWIDEGSTVVERHKLTGHSGEGIVIVDKVDDLSVCPLYVKYILKKHEYRLHFVGGKLIDCQRKMRSNDVADEAVNWKVRNLAGGFVYGREGVVLPEKVLNAAHTIFTTTQLDFGAVDVIYNAKKDEAYVLEINTAPGLSGTTLDKYAEYIKELVDK